ncbi:MAG: hypothetical protein F4Y88_07540 [Chloroflexi bacterium]|nr:hypothetical protein [Chloroflexota bacterium]
MNLRPGPAKKAILIGTDDASMELWRRIRRPTPRHLLGWPMPENVEGGIVYEALEDPNWYLSSNDVMR